MFNTPWPFVELTKEDNSSPHMGTWLFMFEYENILLDRFTIVFCLCITLGLQLTVIFIIN